MIARKPKYCNHCGELIKENHRYNDGLFIGDTFISYVPHECKAFTAEISGQKHGK